MLFCFCNSENSCTFAVPTYRKQKHADAEDILSSAVSVLMFL
nr:MAG TPA: hypothetical protein [Caudoviricetes sp.]